MKTPPYSLKATPEELVPWMKRKFVLSLEGIWTRGEETELDMLCFVSQNHLSVKLLLLQSWIVYFLFSPFGGRSKGSLLTMETYPVANKVNLCSPRSGQHKTLILSTTTIWDFNSHTNTIILVFQVGTQSLERPTTYPVLSIDSQSSTLVHSLVDSTIRNIL